MFNYIFHNVYDIVSIKKSMVTKVWGDRTPRALKDVFGWTVFRYIRVFVSSHQPKDRMFNKQKIGCIIGI